MLHEKLKLILDPIFEYYADLHRACLEANPERKWTLGQQRFSKYLNGVKYDIKSKMTRIEHLVQGNPEDKWENNRMSYEELKSKSKDNDTLVKSITYRRNELPILRQDLVELQPELELAEKFEEDMGWEIDFNYRKQSKVYSKKSIDELIVDTDSIVKETVEFSKSIRI